MLRSSLLVGTTVACCRAWRPSLEGRHAHRRLHSAGVVFRSLSGRKNGKQGIPEVGKAYATVVHSLSTWLYGDYVSSNCSILHSIKQPHGKEDAPCNRVHKR